MKTILLTIIALGLLSSVCDAQDSTKYEPLKLIDSGVTLSIDTTGVLSNISGTANAFLSSQAYPTFGGITTGVFTVAPDTVYYNVYHTVYKPIIFDQKLHWAEIGYLIGAAMCLIIVILILKPFKK